MLVDLKLLELFLRNVCCRSVILALWRQQAFNDLESLGDVGNGTRLRFVNEGLGLEEESSQVVHVKLVYFVELQVGGFRFVLKFVVRHTVKQVCEHALETALVRLDCDLHVVLKYLSVLISCLE